MVGGKCGAVEHSFNALHTLREGREGKGREGREGKKDEITLRVLVPKDDDTGHILPIHQIQVMDVG